MALDVYVGGFSRYFAREWENVAQRGCRERGIPYNLISAAGSITSTPWEEVAVMAADWRKAMNQSLAEHLAQPLQWDETREAPYFTDRPGYDGFGALLVFAAYLEAGREPPQEYSLDWYRDPVYQEVSASNSPGKFGALLRDELWLPGEFEFSFVFPDLTGREVRITSNLTLSWAIHRLRECGLDGEGPGADFVEELASKRPSLRELAEYGLRVFDRLNQLAIKHHLPMLLDT